MIKSIRSFGDGTLQDNEEFDYVVVGAGSAGCVVARRLSDSGASVLLLEAGGSERSWKIQMPSAYAYPLADKRMSWMLETAPQANLDNRKIAWPAGKMLGGSSSINGMVYVRGHALDFEGWKERGAEGWGYADVLPYFKRAENRLHGGNEYRGTGGLLTVTKGINYSPLFNAFVEAGQQAGYGHTEDPNGYRQDGFGLSEMTVKGGVRASTFAAYIRPILPRENLTIVTGARADRLLLEQKRVVGVAYTRNRETCVAKARREVILSAGAVHTPRLLLLSGIGPAAELEALGIEVRHDLPGVGRNLQDHIELYVQFACKKPVTLHRHMSLIGKGMIGAQWFLTKTGICGTNHAEAGGFVCSAPDVDYPDIQFHFVPLAIDYHGYSPVKGDSFQVHVGPTRPTSHGAIKLKSANPADNVHIQPNYNNTEADRKVMRACIRISRKIMAQLAMKDYVDYEISPGPTAVSDADLDAFVRRTAESGYHYAGTCRMGVDKDAVTNPQAQVHGISGLRVADASLMPSLTNGNTNAPSIMIGEKVSDHILGKGMLAPLELEFYRQSEAATTARKVVKEKV